MWKATYLYIVPGTGGRHRKKWIALRDKWKEEPGTKQVGDSSSAGYASRGVT